MTHNFHLVRDITAYIAKGGQRSGSGEWGTINFPFPSLAQYFGGVPGSSQAVVGTGSYEWVTQFSGGSPGTSEHHLEADGYVVIRGDRTTRYANFVNSGARFTGLTFEQFAGFNFRQYGYGNPVYYKRCVFKVLPEFAAAGNSSAASLTTFEDCVFVNVNFTDPYFGGSSSNAALTFTRCLFFNCTTSTAFGTLDHCYLDATSSLAANSATGNNVDPGCNPGEGHGLNVGGAGLSRTSPQGISAAPRFNALAYDDYSVQAGSPHLAAAIGPVQYRQGSTFLVQGPGAGQRATSANTTFTALDSSPAVSLLSPSAGLMGTAPGESSDQTGLVIRADENTSGREVFVTGPARHSSGSPRTLSRMQALGGYNFDTDYPANESELNPRAPQVYNNNVPTLAEPAPGSAGRRPARLTYGLRWSVKPNPDPNVDDDWALGSTFVECEWNTQPLYNPTTLIGNGHPDFDPAQGRAVVCTWYQLRIGLSNMYYH